MKHPFHLGSTLKFRTFSRTLLWLLLPVGLAASACEVFPNPVYPTTFDTSVKVVAKGTGTEYSIQELFPDDDGNKWLYFGSDDYSSRWMTWRTPETVELNGRLVDALRVEYTIQNSYAPVNGGKNVIEGMGPSEKETWWFSPGIGVVMKASGYNTVQVLRYGFVKGRSVEGDLAE